jgi:hypothetical protein
MADDSVEIIPAFLGRSQERDIRNVVRGDAGSGVANVRMRVTLETPGFAVDLGGTELAAEIAEMIRAALEANLERGLDAQGRALPPLKQATLGRRARRRRQREDDSGARADRFKVRGGRNRGKAYVPTNQDTPMNESGLAAENVVVTFKGTESGDPVFLISAPSGGKGRGLELDDGRGARLFAFDHYGFERLMDIPHSLDAAIDKAMEGHLGDVLAAGGSVLKLLGRLGKKTVAVVEQGAAGEDESG